jgi:hypothetical protein
VKGIAGARHFVREYAGQFVITDNSVPDIFVSSSLPKIQEKAHELSTLKYIRSAMASKAAMIQTGRIVLQYHMQQSTDSFREGFAGNRFKRNSSANQSIRFEF